MAQDKGKRLVGRFVALLVGAAIVGLIVLGLMPKPIEVDVGEAQSREIEVTVDEDGKTRVTSRFVVSAPVMGNLARVTLKPGDDVREGAILAELSPMTPGLLDTRTRSEAQARKAMAQANLERARVSVKRAATAATFAREEASRQRSLHERQSTSTVMLEQVEFEQKTAEEDLAAAKFAQSVALHEVEMAKAALASMSGSSDPLGGPTLQVTSPIEGRVLKVFRESEGVVQAGTPLLELGNPEALEITVDVLSTDAVKVKPGALARIERWGGDRPLSARVRKKEPSAFTTRSALGVEEQRVTVVLDLLDPPEQWRALGDGYRVEARIRVAHADRTLVAPASAVFRDGERFAAFVLKDGLAQKRAIDVGLRTPDWVQIKGGIEEGERVVLYPSDQVQDGVKVAPVP